MNVWQALVLGIVQGLTEFLPISSSAHLILVPWLLGWPEPGLAFNVALHLGTLTAVLAYFGRDLVRIARAWLVGLAQRQPFGSQEARLGWAILIGSVPAGVAGVLLNDVIDQYFHSGGGGASAIALTAVLLIGLGTALWLGERAGRQSRSLADLRLRDGFLVGLAQALALLPGVSRSGSTITASLFLDFQRASAARFSFLLGIPAIGGAGMLETMHLLRTGLPASERTLFLVGMVGSAVTGFLAIAFLLRFLQRHSTGVFVLYRFLLGACILVWLIAVR